MIVKILMIDDHPSQVEGYKSILKFNSEGYDLDVKYCGNCKDAYSILTSKTSIDFDIIFLDYNLPSYPEENINNGEDIGLVAREYSSNSKIIMLTSHSEAFIIYDILKRLKPEGLMIKSDFSAENLLEAFNKVMSGGSYFTESVIKAKKSLTSQENFLDRQDRKIIQLLAKGYKTKTLPSKLNLSQSAIEKRKSNIKIYLGLEQASDQDIIQTARKLGFIS